MVGKLENRSDIFWVLCSVCVCKCGARVAGHAREATRSLQVGCTRLGPTLGVFFGPQNVSVVLLPHRLRINADRIERRNRTECDFLGVLSDPHLY